MNKCENALLKAKIFAVTAQRVVIKVLERTSECPETRKFKKCPHKKNASQYLKE